MTRAAESRKPEFGMVYSRFLMQSFSVAALMAALGYLPTIRLAGIEGLPSMFAAIVTAFIASLIGTIPIFRSRRVGPLNAMPYQFAAMALRLLSILVLGIVVVLGSQLEMKPFMLWLAIGHIGFLITDTQLARSAVQVAAEREAREALEER